jgi:3-oxoacyl-[acyl-carrier protein] reductase
VDDIAAAVLFLASPEARHVTGETLMVDGGWTIYSPLPANHPQVPPA